MTGCLWIHIPEESKSITRTKLSVQPLQQRVGLEVQSLPIVTYQLILRDQICQTYNFRPHYPSKTHLFKATYEGYISISPAFSVLGWSPQKSNVHNYFLENFLLDQSTTQNNYLR